MGALPLLLALPAWDTWHTRRRRRDDTGRWRCAAADQISGPKMGPRCAQGFRLKKCMDPFKGVGLVVVVGGDRWVLKRYLLTQGNAVKLLTVLM
jgi:hypothetical protein